jgi:hypothetical protein
MRSLIFTLCALIPFAEYYAQGIINNGAYIVISGAARIYVDGGTNGDYLSQANGLITPSATGIIMLEGDWTNNAANTGFTADAGEVQLVDAAQTINGTNSTTFYNLTLLGTNTKTLNVNTSVGGVATTTGVLSLGTRPLDLNTRMLTITNPATTAITTTTGYIISETNAAANSSIVRWNTGATTGSYVIPFGTTGGVSIPLTVGITVGLGAGQYFQVATRPTAVSSNLPWSTGVTHMYDPNLAQDGSDEAVIDRWWDFTFSAANTPNITYSYRGVENTMIAPYNTGNIGAQYWSAAWLPNNANIGSAPAVLAGVGTVTAAVPFAAGAFTPTVLSSLAAPLPIELVNFSSQCNGNSVLVSWSTATETNNSYFTLQRSDDGINFRDIAVVQGAGNSSQLLNYSFTDSEPVNGTAYYRLKQTDFNGQSSTTSLIAQEACGSAGEVIHAFGANGQIIVDVFTPMDNDYVISVFDPQGKLVHSESMPAAAGSNRRTVNYSAATGVYLVRVTGTGEESDFAERIYVQK